MKKYLLSAVALALLSGCVATTVGGASGVERRQLLLVSEAEINAMSDKSYNELVEKAHAEGKLASGAELNRLQRIAQRLIPQTNYLRAGSSQWSWQVNLIQSDQLNAFCAPGGKIMFYSGIVNKLQLSDDEIAAIMGHEMAHALREHGRENVSRAYAEQAGINILAGMTGMGEGMTQMAGVVSKLGFSLPNNRTQETEADIQGLELMARAGYHPQAAITLWQKIAAANAAGTPQFMSTHPAPANRIANLQNLMPRVMPLYEQARQ